jgi:uncharacterized membrane protein YdfJ with MMPL/SSD domain
LQIKNDCFNYHSPVLTLGTVVVVLLVLGVVFGEVVLDGVVVAEVGLDKVEGSAALSSSGFSGI